MLGLQVVKHGPGNLLGRLIPSWVYRLLNTGPGTLLGRLVQSWVYRVVKHGSGSLIGSKPVNHTQLMESNWLITQGKQMLKTDYAFLIEYQIFTEYLQTILSKQILFFVKSINILEIFCIL